MRARRVAPALADQLFAIVDHGRVGVVADSNRFEAPVATTALTVVSTAAALADRPAVVGTIATGNFPR